MKIAETSKVTGKKRKRGRPHKIRSEASPLKNQEKDNVCFICFDGGNLVPCDHRDCTKVYHPHCIDSDETVFYSRHRWNCAMHICSNCENAAHFMCYMCTYSLCKRCMEEAGFLCDRGNKGFCKLCLRTVSLIEMNKQENNETAQVQVDFEDENVWEGFKDYWILLKEKLSLTLDNLTQVGDPWKEYGHLAHKKDSTEEKYDSKGNHDFTSTSCSGNHEVSTSEFENTMGKSKSYKEGPEYVGKSVPGEGLSISNKANWASKELLDFVAYMKRGDTSVLSEFDVKALLISYIKENNLRHPLRKSQINCDSRLATLFGKRCVMHFEMLRLLESFILVKQETQTDEIHGGNSEVEVSQLEADSSDDAWTRTVIKERSKTRKNCVEREEQANLVSHLLVESHQDHGGSAVIEVSCGDARTETDIEKRLRNVVEKERQMNLDDYAAIDVHNISLIFLKRTSLQNLLNEGEKFQDKVIGTFVRTKIIDSGQKQELFRLVQVVGTKKTRELYQVGGTTTDVMLEILNVNRKEIISIQEISDQDFSEDECKHLRQSIRCGFLSRMTVGEIQEKAKVLKVVRTNNLWEAENLQFDHLRDQASEKEHRIRSDAFHRKRKVLMTSGKGGSDSNNAWTRARKVSTTSLGVSRNMITKGVVSVGDKGNSDTDADDSSRNQGRDALESRSEKSNNQALATGLESGSSDDQAVIISNSFSPPETALVSLGKKAELSSTSSGAQIHLGQEVGNECTWRPQYNRNLIDKLWHFKDRSGKTGPYSEMQHLKLCETGYFPANMRLLRTRETKDNSIQMAHALNGKLLEESPHSAGNGVYKATGPEQGFVFGPTASTSPVHHMDTGNPTKNGEVTLKTEVLSSTKVEVAGYLQEDPSTSSHGLSPKSDMGNVGVTSSIGAQHTYPSMIIDNRREVAEDDVRDPLNKCETNVPLGAGAEMQDRSDIDLANIQDIVPEQPTSCSAGTMMDIDRDSLPLVVLPSNDVASTVSSSGISPQLHRTSVLSSTTSDTETCHGEEEREDNHALKSMYSRELTDNIWHYQVPNGKIQGPHSMLQLRKWFTLGYIPADMRLWRATENQDESILMIDAFNWRFLKESPYCLGNGGDSQTKSLEHTTISGPNASSSLSNGFVSGGPTKDTNMKPSHGLVSSIAVEVCENLLPGSQGDPSTSFHDSNSKSDPVTSGAPSTSDPQQSLQSTAIGEPNRVSQVVSVDSPNESAAHLPANAEVDEQKSCRSIRENLQGIVHEHLVPSSTGTSLNTNTNFVSVNDSPSKAVANSKEDGMNKNTCRMTYKRELTGKFWQYQDQSGNIQGPYSLVQLRKWCSTGYFPANLRLWRKGNQDDSILMIDALSGKLLKTPVDSSANGVVSQAPGLEQATVLGPNASESPAHYTSSRNSTKDGNLTLSSGLKSNALTSLSDSSPIPDPGTSGVLFSVDGQQNPQHTMTDNPHGVTQGDFYYRSNESATESLAPVGLDGKKGSVIVSTTIQGIVREGLDPLTPAYVGTIAHTGPNSISATISPSKALALSVLNRATSVNNHRSEENYHGLQFRLTQKLEIYRKTETEPNGWGSDPAERTNPSRLPFALQKPEAPDHGYRDVGPSSLYKSDESVNDAHEAGNHPLPRSSVSVSTPIETKSESHPSVPNWEMQIQENQDTGKTPIPEDSNTGWSPWPEHVNENMRWDVSRERTGAALQGNTDDWSTAASHGTMPQGNDSGWGITSHDWETTPHSYSMSSGSPSVSRGMLRTQHGYSGGSWPEQWNQSPHGGDSGYGCGSASWNGHHGGWGGFSGSPHRQRWRVCWHYKRGYCSRGTRCNFLHP